MRERRERHRRRAWPIRAASAVVGFALLVAAIAFFWFPEVGLPLAYAGLRVLALEFEWAERAHTWLEEQARRALAWWRRRTRAMKASILVVVTALVVWGTVALV